MSILYGNTTDRINLDYEEIRLLERIFEDSFQKKEMSSDERMELISSELKNLIELRQTGDQSKFLKNLYKLIFDHYHKHTGHYFRHLYHVLKFIYAYEIIEIEQESNKGYLIKDKFRNYSDIVQASLSSSELFLLFYNGLCFKEMKKLLHHFDFLENLAYDDLLDAVHTASYGECKIDGIDYPAILFKSRDELII